jgi:hypothetical protein
MKGTVGLYILVFLLLTVPVSCPEYIPPNIGELANDYYDVSGEPNLSVASVQNPEFDSGEASSLFIKLKNRGLLTTFETDELPNDSSELRDADKELQLESDVTTAMNIHGVLENNRGAPVKIVSGVREAGYLREGETSAPVKFEIEVFKTSPSGVYELSLNLTYHYQKEVQVAGYPEPKFNYWYDEKQQVLPIYINVRPKVDFEVGKVRAQKVSDKEFMLYITYRNTGSEGAENAVARIIEEDPFKFDDDTASLGTLSPGGSSESKYLIEVKEDALPKTYGIETEVEYRDSRGEKKKSPSMRAPFRMAEALREERKGTELSFAVLLGIMAAAGYYVYRKEWKKKKEE